MKKIFNQFTYHTISFLFLAILIGSILFILSVPAGWLIGGLFAGILYHMLFKKVKIDKLYLKIAQTFIGINIGLMMNITLFKSLTSLILPITVALVIIFISGILLSKLLYKVTNLDYKTAFFCSIPGGASEVISLSGEYEADQRVVATFHTSRILFIVLFVPFLLSFYNGDIDVPFTLDSFYIPLTFFPIIGILVGATFFLIKKYPFPASALIFSILLSFIINYPLHLEPIPLLAGVGQAWIGGIIGLQFDRSTLEQLKKIGGVAIIFLVLLLAIGIGIGIIFYFLTPLDFSTSLLSIIPAGAVEMVSIALFLGLDSTLVAGVQILRLLSTYFLLPFFTKWILHQTKKDIRNADQR
ncbi:AbrB family transcriptional regulator [Sutcliffiella cohnii]|uniref:AbrB family transcriptional regulator n=1 Tax=Sutcliffiella cohnii TaxID=33932 RepID=UPI002E22F153|nr:AbrB family transcriptional regulator [Sutcliffiella cohnii]